MFSRKINAPTTLGGFSLIEVLITSAIIGIVTTIVVVKYGAFNSTVLLRNQAYELGLAVRQAQVYSVSVRSAGSGYREPYGIYVSTASPQQYTLFVDTNSPPNGLYDPGEEVETFTLDSRFEVHELCLGSDTNQNCGISDLSIVFHRPDFDANMSSADAYPASQLGSIVLAGTNDTSITRTVEIRQTGLISVQ